MKLVLSTLALCLLLVASAASAATGLAALDGTWTSTVEERRERDGGRTAVEVVWLLEGDWLQLTVRDSEPSGRSYSEILMIRQAPDGGVAAYLFEAGRSKPRALLGGWDGNRLRLTGSDSAESWIWDQASSCEAILARETPGLDVELRTGKSALFKEACAGGKLVDEGPTKTKGPVTADGRSLDAKPGPIVPAAPAEGAGGEKTPPDSGDRSDEGNRAPAGTTAEVEVADLPAARQVAPAAEGGSRVVIVAGRGKPLDEVRKAIDQIRAFLVENGVQAEGPSDEIVVLQEADASLAYLVRQVRDRQAASLIYVGAFFGGRERITADCYNGDGLQLWREKVVGGTAMRKFEWMNPRLVERIEERLENRLGDACLPTGGAGTP